MRSVSGFSAVVVLLQSDDGSLLAPAGWILAGGQPGSAELTEPATGSSAGARVLELAVTLVFSSSDNPPGDLPIWASVRGFGTGVVVPLSKHGRQFGVVYALRRDPYPPTDPEIHLTELAVMTCGRTLPSPLPSVIDEDSDASDLLPSAFEAVHELAPLRFDDLELMPLREEAVLGDVEVSLSRTEFLMLYTLGMQANRIVPHHVLLETCWPDDLPALSAVDAAVYRLRKKLSRAEAEAGKQIVKTVRGKGYMLDTG